VLETTYEAAAEVDAERGWTGDGLAEVVGDWLKAVRLEVYGPSGAQDWSSKAAREKE